MKKRHFYLCILVCATGLIQLPALSEASRPRLELVWADEFEADGKPDPANWNFEEGFVRNEELQWYQADNAFCENGKLIIEGRKEKKPNPNYQPGSKHWKTRRKHAQYTSSSLTTRGLQHFQYGRFEIRARIKARDGLWPAIWTLGIKGEWPVNGEIDIMEYYKGDILANVASGTRRRFKPKWDSSKTPVAELGNNWDEDFHIWRMDWDKEAIRLYVDDRLLNETLLFNTNNPDGHEIKNPFHQPHYMLLNLAIGGRSGGDPSKTAFPTRYEIDYVRVYQKKTEQE